MNNTANAAPRNARGPLLWILAIIAVITLGAAVAIGSVATARAVEQGVFSPSETTTVNDERQEIAGADSTTAPVSSDATPVVIILDASGSMVRETANGSTRMDVAREAVATTIANLPEGAEVGLLVFGTGTGNTDAEREAGCQDVVTLSEIGPVDHAELQNSVSGIEASGFTPLGPALTQASSMFGDGQSGNIVLISDGVDTCSPPPACEIASELHSSNSGLAIHVVGFSLDDDEQTQQQLQCIGETGGGSYTEANNIEQLTSKLNIAVDPELEGHSLSESGFNDVGMGMRLDEVLSLVPDAEVQSQETRDGIEYVYVDCGWGTIELQDDGVTQIIPVEATPTRDGLAVGDPIADAETLYGPAVDSGTDDHGAFGIYAIDTGIRTGYRVYEDSGTITQITVCLCVPVEESASELSSWEVEFDRIGPIRLGDSMEQVQRAVPWLQAPVEGENFYAMESYSGETGGYQWTHYEGSDSSGYPAQLITLELNPDRTVRLIQVGNQWASSLEDFPDGSLLPAARGIRVGDTALTARYAYPDGTVFVNDVGGAWRYAVTDREGHSLAFVLSASSTENFSGAVSDFDGALIMGIQIEDGTKRSSWYDMIPYILEDQGLGGDSVTETDPEAAGNIDSDTGSLTALERFDPWADGSVVASAEEGEALIACGRDGYRSDLVSCVYDEKCYLNDGESEMLCVGIVGTSIGWTLHPVEEQIGESGSASEEARPVLLELSDGRVCFFGTGAAPEPAEGFGGYSGACQSPNVPDEFETLWAYPLEGEAEFLPYYFVEPGISGFLRVGVGGDGYGAKTELVDVVTMYW
ncbi:MAG: VWA domain-containing protein [Gulosibacter sp.]|uniref:VWA domain-containing protein n=1 Tax=Gulosibacter sp. TaxID=2817531 RepID=UPI003F8E390B